MSVLEFLIVVIVILWVTGFAFSVGGSLIHLLLVLILILIVLRLVQGRGVL